MWYIWKQLLVWSGRYAYQLNALIVGPQNAGKTTLMQRLTETLASEEEKDTDITKLVTSVLSSVGDDHMQMEVTDTPGDLEGKFAADASASRVVHVTIVVADGTALSVREDDVESGSGAVLTRSKLRAQIAASDYINGTRKFIDEALERGGLVVLAVNKADNDINLFKWQQELGLASYNGNPKFGVFYISALKGVNVKQMTDWIMSKLTVA